MKKEVVLYKMLAIFPWSQYIVAEMLPLRDPQTQMTPRGAVDTT